MALGSSVPATMLRARSESRRLLLRAWCRSREKAFVHGQVAALFAADHPFGLFTMIRLVSASVSCWLRSWTSTTVWCWTTAMVAMSQGALGGGDVVVVERLKVERNRLRVTPMVLLRRRMGSASRSESFADGDSGESAANGGRRR